MSEFEQFLTHFDLKKTLFHTLKQIPGLRVSTIIFLCKRNGIDRYVKLEKLSRLFWETLMVQIKNELLTGKRLRSITKYNRKLLLQNKSLRGLRQRRGFPSRGQQTHSNGKTAKKLLKF